jgi:thioredoxin reductase (NADPH)
MIKKAEDNPKIEFVLNSTIEEIVGDEFVTGIKIRNKISGEISTMELDGVFIAIGHTPTTKLFKDDIKTDEKGYIITGNDTVKTATNIPGVFACGDIQDSKYQQAITAAGSGCMAALDAEKYIEEQEG